MGGKTTFQTVRPILVDYSSWMFFLDGRNKGRFLDREEAGFLLGERLKDQGVQKDSLILGIPRGGVVVAYHVAKILGSDLDIVSVKKLQAPQNPELAIGAVGPKGKPVLDNDLIAALGVSQKYLRKEIKTQQKEAFKRNQFFRGRQRKPAIPDHDVVIVDDGVATGSTVKAAGKLAKKEKPARLILATPVVAKRRMEELKDVFDEVVALLVPDDFSAVGQFYRNFAPVSDEEIKRLLENQE